MGGRLVGEALEEGKDLSTCSRVTGGPGVRIHSAHSRNKMDTSGGTIEKGWLEPIVKASNARPRRQP